MKFSTALIASIAGSMTGITSANLTQREKYEMAWRSVELCQDAYFEASAVVSSDEFDTGYVFDIGTGTGIVASVDNQVYVASRGTDFSNTDEWGSAGLTIAENFINAYGFDVTFGTTDVNGCTMRAEFVDIADELLATTKTITSPSGNIGEVTMKDLIKHTFDSCKFQNGGHCDLIMAGHSFGGAQALATTARLSEEASFVTPYIFTFGGYPTLHSSGCATIFDSGKIFNFINTDGIFVDPVPLMNNAEDHLGEAIFLSGQSDAVATFSDITGNQIASSDDDYASFVAVHWMDIYESRVQSIWDDNFKDNSDTDAINTTGFYGGTACKWGENELCASDTCSVTGYCDCTSDSHCGGDLVCNTLWTCAEDDWLGDTADDIGDWFCSWLC